MHCESLRQRAALQARGVVARGWRVGLERRERRHAHADDVPQAKARET